MHFPTGREIVILDAAVLLEAEWDSMTHEVWTTFIPKEEVIPLVSSTKAKVYCLWKQKKKQKKANKVSNKVNGFQRMNTHFTGRETNNGA